MSKAWLGHGKGCGGGFRIQFYMVVNDVAHIEDCVRLLRGQQFDSSAQPPGCEEAAQMYVGNNAQFQRLVNVGAGYGALRAHSDVVVPQHGKGRIEPAAHPQQQGQAHNQQYSAPAWGGGRHCAKQTCAKAPDVGNQYKRKGVEGHAHPECPRPQRPHMGKGIAMPLVEQGKSRTQSEHKDAEDYAQPARAGKRAPQPPGYPAVDNGQAYACYQKKSEHMVL